MCFLKKQVVSKEMKSEKVTHRTGAAAVPLSAGAVKSHKGPFLLASLACASSLPRLTTVLLDSSLGWM